MELQNFDTMDLTDTGSNPMGTLSYWAFFMYLTRKIYPEVKFWFISIVLVALDTACTTCWSKEHTGSARAL